MKIGYKICIFSLIVIAIIFLGTVWSTPFGNQTRLPNAIQGIGVFVALLTAIIALSIADSPRRLVKTKIEPFINTKSNIGKYCKRELSKGLRQEYQDLEDLIKSYRVQFDITNTSGFTLKNPTLTFRLPLEKQHPTRKDENGIYRTRTFHSNLFNTQRELRLLEFENTRILSNSNLPYWNKNDKITIWVRMVIDLEPFDIEISVNCENADGITEKVEVNPQELMRLHS